MNKSIPQKAQSFIHQLRGVEFFCEPPKAKAVSDSDEGARYSKGSIDYDEFKVKVNYWSYFSMMGLPLSASSVFHKRILAKDIDGAMAAIEDYFAAPECVKNLRFIRAHIDNALKRLDA